MDSPATNVALIWVLSLAALFIGSARWFGLVGARGAVRSITVVGVLLALVGITQEPFYLGAVYGFWEPRFGTAPFGPFINENHFAGWMMMGLPLVVGYVSAGVSRALRGVRPDWRSRVLWLSSPQANTLLLVAVTAMIMGLALVLTFSRSGITCFALALVLSGWFISPCMNHGTGGKETCPDEAGCSGCREETGAEL